MKHFFKLPAAVLVGVMAIALGGCGSANQTTTEVVETVIDEVDAVTQEPAADNQAVTAAPSDTTLEFQQWWGVELPDGFLANLTRRFTDQSGIGIELLSNPYADTRTQIMAGAATGTMACVVGLDGAWVYDFANQNAIANLSTLMDASGYDQSQLSDQIQINGNTYMIPVVNFAYPMFVNMDILESAGITEVPRTWSEFTDASQRIVDSGQDVRAWAIPLSNDSPSGVQNQFMSWLWASGGSMLNNGHPNLAGNEGLVNTAEFIKTLFDNNLIAPGAFTMREPDMVEEFTNGRVAFMTSSLAHLFMIQQGAPEMNLAVIDIPVQDGFTGESGMTVANWGVGISENCDHKAEAMQFVEFLMSPEINAELAQAASAFPGNVNAEPDYSASPQQFRDAFEIFQRNHAVNEFTGLPVAEDLMRSFNEQLQLYLDGDTATAQDMLQTAQQRWVPAFE